MVSKHKFGKDHPELQIDAPNKEAIEKHYYKYRFKCEWIKKVNQPPPAVLQLKLSLLPV